MMTAERRFFYFRQKFSAAQNFLMTAITFKNA